MRRLPSILFAAALLLAQPALAGTRAEPEVDDAHGDVDVQHLVDTDLLDGDAPAPEELETSADVLGAWVGQETRESFAIHVELADIPDDRNVSSPLVEVWAHFTVREGDYHAAATLSSPRAGAPTEVSFELYEGEAHQGALLGNVDVDEDVVTFRVPKPDVRDPGEGDELTRFHVTTHVPESQAVLDYAPGTDRDSLPALTEDEETDPTDLDLAADPTFGDAYAFRSFEEQLSRLTVTATPPSLEVEAGEQASFAIRVDNDADAPDEVSLSTSNAPPGWSVRVDPGDVTVSSQGSETVTLHVTPAADAEGHELVHVKATSDLGADKGASVSVVAVQPDQPGPSGGSDGRADADENENEADGGGGATMPDGADASEGSTDAEGEAAPGEEADEVPFVSPLILVAGLLGLAALARRTWVP